MPAREALEQHQWKIVDGEIGRVAAALAALTREATLAGQLAEELSHL
jgi:hypothetical protein